MIIIAPDFLIPLISIKNTPLNLEIEVLDKFGAMLKVSYKLNGECQVKNKEIKTA